MIRLRDTTLLALTKLRTRKVRLIVTVTISGLLFSVLVGASMLARGVFNSLGQFNQEGLGSRFIVSASPALDESFYMNTEVLDRAAALQKDLIARKKAEAKRLGVEYSPDADEGPVQESEGQFGKQRFLNPSHPLAIQAIREYKATHNTPGLPELKQLGARYDATAYYQNTFISSDLGGAKLTVLTDGKEKFDIKQASNGIPTGTDSFIGNWQLMSKGLLEPFMLAGQNLEVGKDGSIPVILPLSAAEQLTGLKALAPGASPETQLEHTKQVRAKVSKVTFDVCYRNARSSALVDQAVNTAADIQRNKDKKDYQKPDYIVSLPAQACGPTGVERDARSKEQKAYDAKQTEFNQLFGELPAAQERMKFRIVGIVPDPEMGGSINVTAIIKSLVTSSLGSGWYSPLEVAAKNPRAAEVFKLDANGTSAGWAGYSVEFASADAARTFMDKESCQPDYNYSDSATRQDPYKACRANNKQFVMGAYGSNSLGLDSAKRVFSKIFSIAGLIVAGIAAIIMMGTVGKMIADSRRETAVFRAIGAKRLDIAQIYILYTIFLAIFITLFAILLGFLGAFILHIMWSDSVTVHAILVYNIQDFSKVFKLYHVYPPDMLYLLGTAVLAGLISAVLPLIRNLRRNPMRDMRDDT